MKKSLSIFITISNAVILLIAFCYYKLPPHIALLICIVLLLLIGKLNKKSWNSLEDFMAESIFQALKPIFILALVGILISTWMMSGTVPSILYYGLKYMSPKWFYVNSILLCMLTSTFNGSAITSVSTIGVALMGIAKALELPLPIAAGAVICGSCFGDKCSPLSETTNLAPGILDVDLFSHVRHLIWTTIPAMILTMGIYLFLGMKLPNPDISKIQNLNILITEHFNISFMTLLPPIIVIICIALKVPAMPTFIVGIFGGLIITAIVQDNFDILNWSKVMQDGFHLEGCTNNMLSGLVNKGGLQSMMWSISLIAIALSLGGLLKNLGVIDSILTIFSSKLTSKGMLIFAASISCILINFLTGEQFLSILLPGKAFRRIFEEKKIPLKYLSRTLEDCGTLVNPLIPWGVAGSIFTAALDVRVLDYLPFVFFLFLSPIFTMIFGFLDIEKHITRILKKVKL